MPAVSEVLVTGNMPTKKPTKQLKEARSQFESSLSGETFGTVQPFWKTKTLAEMTPEEWESLCDGCGRCCLIKLEDEDTGDIAVTRLACKLLDLGTCRCSKYEIRHAYVPDCVVLTPKDIEEMRWLPETCAYRLIHEGDDLRWWHPLVSGTPDTIHEAGISVRNMAISETKVPEHRVFAHIASWLKAS